MTISLLDQSTVICDLGADMATGYARMRAKRLGLDEAEMVRLTLHYWHSGSQHELALQQAAQELAQ